MDEFAGCSKSVATVVTPSKRPCEKFVEQVRLARHRRAEAGTQTKNRGAHWGCGRRGGVSIDDHASDLHHSIRCSYAAAASFTLPYLSLRAQQQQGDAAWPSMRVEGDGRERRASGPCLETKRRRSWRVTFMATAAGSSSSSVE